MTTFIDGWTSKPFPKLAFSAGGVLALADLHTIAQRTAIAGGASWFDALVLAPGIHYQQAADELFRKGGAVAITDVVDEFRGSPVTFELRNAAIAHYIQQVAKPGMTVTLNVGRLVAAKGRYKLSRSNSGLHATAWRDTVKPETGWLSHALYLTTPFITVVSITLLVIFKDWWTLLSIVTLMISRILNIWVIKRRASHTDNSKDPPQTPQSPQSPQSPPLHTSNTARGPGENSSRSNRPGRVSFSETRQRLCHCFLRVANFERKAMVHLRGKKNDLRDAISKQW
ncbi:uncharacterized protein P884DRAFT_53474 [Thermothelomyces heterothallicus CBS 202.75]|uniref:uncharacterized protein n=1 Tax=Thermothelomyces heterothallicus CBS 202.75 TaxID=1149848 RepID=UPI0037422B58